MNNLLGNGRRCWSAVTLILVFMVTPPLAAQSVGVDQILPRVAKVFGTGGLNRLESWQSAVAVSPDGLFVTAWSYVLDNGATVVLNDGRRFQAELVGYHPAMELALIRIDVADQPCFELDDQRTIVPGTSVYALSNLYGIATGNESVSVQRGVVSAVTNVTTQRGPRSGGYQGPALIVDTVVNNPGSAGGAITDRQGNLLGVIGRESRDAVNQLWLNYAIPASQVAIAIREIQSGQARSAAMAIELPLEPVTPELLGLLLVPEVVSGTPPWIEQVMLDSPAQRAGLRADDLIIEVNGMPTATRQRILEQLARIDRENRFSITVQREGKFVSVEISINHPLP